MHWIDRQEQEPDPKDRRGILVYGQWGSDPCVVWVIVSCHYDYGTWCDVIDGNSIDFRYWMPWPPQPEQEAQERVA